MDVQKLLIWEAQKQIYSMKGKNMDLKEDNPKYFIIYYFHIVRN